MGKGQKNNESSLDQTIINSLISLNQWVKSNKYKGWDPYDGINTHILETMKSNHLKILAIQFHKYSPLNLRPLFRIKKGIDLKGVSLFSQAYSILYLITKMREFLNDLKWTISFLKRNSLEKKYGAPVWSAHYFPVIGFDKSVLQPDVPDIIGTLFSIKALIIASKVIKGRSLLNYANKSMEYVLHDMLRKYGNLLYVMYTPFDENRIIPDATALLISVLHDICQLTGYYEYKHTIQELTNTLIELQKPDGSWPHAIYLNMKSEYNQIDYHQGFFIDALIKSRRVIKQTKTLDHTLKKAIQLYEKTFLSDGRSYYRYPKKYPTDIHNQAQGIITFSQLYNEFNDGYYLELANKIAVWTIQNMQDPRGYFYYQKGRMITNRIPYMRWGQAWMILALATLLKAQTQGGYTYEDSHGRTR